MVIKSKPKKSKKKNFYVDNKKFYEAMCIFHKARKADPKFPVTEYIGGCILLICQKLSFSPNFINYSFREEMVSDAIENCLLYIHNFKPVLTKEDQNEKNRIKKSNPFSYFTQYAFNAFLRRIEKEKGLQRLKAKYVQNMAVMDAVFGDAVVVSTQEHDSNDKFTQDAAATLQFYYNYDISPRAKKAAKNKVETKKEKALNATDLEKNFS